MHNELTGLGSETKIELHSILKSQAHSTSQTNEGALDGANKKKLWHIHDYQTPVAV
jgi:hypothetical protein